MKHIKLHLLIHLLRTLRPSLLALPAALLYVTLTPTPLFEPVPQVVTFTFIFAHCLLITLLLGQWQSSGFGYLYSRGFTRNTLWRHQVLASLLAALAVWLPASLCLWLPVRSFQQSRVFLNAYYPLVAPRESELSVVWLAAYLIFLPALHYAWVRRTQRLTEPRAGSMLAGALLVAVSALWVMGQTRVSQGGWFAWLLLAAGATLTAALLWGTKRLHRRMELF